MENKNQLNAMNELTITEFIPIINLLLDRNKELEDMGKTPKAFNIEGEAGCGKTSIVEQIAKKRGMTYVKVNLSEMEEVGDIAGFPYKEYLIKWTDKDGNKQHKWINEVLLDKIDTKAITGEVRMAYAAPAWVPREENPNGTILLIDDYSRANSLFMQAVMELINTCGYMTWSLPKYTTIICTSNPDNGEYNVSSLDVAQKTRLCNFNLKFDVEAWAKWAEYNHIDGRAINFALQYRHELFDKNNTESVVKNLNSRSYTNFCDLIGGFKNWDSPETLATILNISKGCFIDDNNNVIGGLFTSFIEGHLDKLIQPKEILEGSWETVSKQIEECVYDSNGNFKCDISYIIGNRLLNYICYYYDQPNSKEKVVEERLLDFIHSETQLIGKDIMMHLIKEIVTKYPRRAGKLISIKDLRDQVMI